MVSYLIAFVQQITINDLDPLNGFRRHGTVNADLFGAFAGVFLRLGGADRMIVDNYVIKIDGGSVMPDEFEVPPRSEPVGLSGLGHKIADKDLYGGRSGDRATIDRLACQSRRRAGLAVGDLDAAGFSTDLLTTDRRFA